jgi:quercetin dioxygenase-like cupin family protein
MELTEKLKLLRVQRRMTLQNLSEKSGVSISLLSQIERGLSAPTITTLQKIANSLEITLSSLFSDNETAAPVSFTKGKPPNSDGVSVVRKGDRKRLIMPWGADYEMLSPNLQHKIEFILLHYPAGTELEEFYSHHGEECGIVLEGRFRGIIGDQEIILEAGDSIYYDSSIPHRWENAEETEVRAIWAITPPSF